MSNLSFVEHIGDGSTTQFLLSVNGDDIGYIRTEDIHVYVDDVEVTFTIESDTPHIVILSEAPATGSAILIRREMPQELPYSDFSRGNKFSPKNLNNSFLQSLYLTQEALDGFLPEGTYQKQDMDFGDKFAPTRIRDPLLEGDATNKKYVDDVSDRVTAIEDTVVAGDTRYISYPYKSGSADGGELFLTLPYVFETINRVYINGVHQTEGLAWDYDRNTQVVELAEELEAGDEVVIEVGLNPERVIDNEVVSSNAEIIATGTTIPRTLGDRFSDRLTLRDFGVVGDGVVDDTTQVISAINYSIENEVIVDGGNLSCLVTANLPNLHDSNVINVRLIRDSSSFHTSNSGSHENILYVSTSGSDSNDGITPSLPMATASAAFGTLDKYEIILDGLWSVEFAAGIYDQTTQATIRAKSKNRVKIYGPNVGHPNVPTAIFDGGGSGDDYTVGWYQTGEGTLIDVADIKFIDFNGDPSGRTRGALICDQGGNIVTHNVHAENCSWYGIYISFMSRARIRGGILTNCREALNTNNSQVSVASTGTLAGGTIFRNSTEKGVYWSRSTQGHVDDCTFEDNVTGIVVAEGSRVDAVRNNYKRNGTGVSTSSGGMYGDNPNAPSNFNAGTADANGIAIRNKSGGLDYNGTYGDFATSILRVNQDRLERSPTAVLTKQTLSTLWTMPAPWLDDIYKEIRIKSYIRVTSALVVATDIYIDLGAEEVILLRLPSTAVGVYVMEVQIFSNTVGSQKAYGMIIGPNGTTRTASSNSSIDTTAATGVNLSMKLGDVLDQPKIKAVRTTIDAIG